MQRGVGGGAELVLVEFGGGGMAHAVVAQAVEDVGVVGEGGVLDGDDGEFNMRADREVQVVGEGYGFVDAAFVAHCGRVSIGIVKLVEE